MGYICENLKVEPSDTIMVGDTPADTLMGQQANVGLTVGVLSGVGTHEDLSDADVVVQDVRECVEMILPRLEKDAKLHRVTTRGLFKIARLGALLGSSSASSNNNINEAQRRAFSTSSNAAESGFSHVIVGAGSAGCVLANRLTEDRKRDY